jgi:predicted nucleic acid-binding protein
MTWRVSQTMRLCQFHHLGVARPPASACLTYWLRFALRAPLADLLVVDAAVIITACLSETGMKSLGREELVAPHLMWSEASSVLHELRSRKEISGELASIALERLAAADISPRRPKGLTEEAWHVADRLGWAKTYDAEYLALAQLLRCRLSTTDPKLKAGGSGLVNVIGPAEL